MSVNPNKNKMNTNGMMRYVFNILSPYYLKPLTKLPYLFLTYQLLFIYHFPFFSESSFESGFRVGGGVNSVT